MKTIYWPPWNIIGGAVVIWVIMTIGAFGLTTMSIFSAIAASHG